MYIAQLISFCLLRRPVSQADVLTLERRLLLTMDMILAKKKRIAIDRKRNKTTSPKQGLWGMLSSVAQLSSSAESMHQFFHQITSNFGINFTHLR